MPIPIDCDADCGGYTFAEFQGTPELYVSFLMLCRLATLASTVQDGAIDVNVTGTAPSGTQTELLATLTEGDPDVVIPMGWTSYSVGSPYTNTGNGTIEGSPIIPGQTHGVSLQPGYTSSATVTISATGTNGYLFYSFTTIDP